MAVMALLILLIGIVTPSFFIQPVKAQGVSYTVATGAVPDSTAYNPQRKLAVTSDGHIHAVYHRLDSNGILQIYHAESADEGKTWAEDPVTYETKNQSYPAIGTDSQNNLHIVWTGYTSESPGITQIRYRKWTTSGWGSIVDLTHDTGWHQDTPAIAVDSNNYLHVVWHKAEFNAGYWCTRGSKPDGCGPIYYMKYTGSWSEPVRIGISDQNNEAHPSIAVDSNDYINVAWNEGGYQNADCWHSASSFFTTSWQTIESFECLATWPSIAVDSKEKVHLALIADYPIHRVIYRSRTASGWGSPETLYSYSSYGITPSIAVDSNDYLHVVWPEDGNIKYRNYTTSWQNTKTIISDTTSSWPNLLWAWNPQVNGKRPNILQNGYAFLYTSGQDIKFYYDKGETIPQPQMIPSIELQKDGIRLEEIGLNVPLNINVAASSGSITQIRFSSDDLQNGNAEGQWTTWYDWTTSSGDWNSATHIMKWTFATLGKKEVWMEIRNGAGQTSRINAQISVHPGYALIISGQGKGWQDNIPFQHAANNAYRSLRNLGFDDEHIIYLSYSPPQDLDSDGFDEVDYISSLSNFDQSIDEIKNNIKSANMPLILYFIGHGDPGEFHFDNQETSESKLYAGHLKSELNEFSNDNPIVIFIFSCYSGSFITIWDGISAQNRIIITGAHDDFDLFSIPAETRQIFAVHSSDRIFGNLNYLNKGLNLKDAFTFNSLPDEWLYLWLDDDGDKEGRSILDLGDEGFIAEKTKIGFPGTENLELTPWQLAWVKSPVELRVIDSNNHVTGIVNGNVKQDIPDSVFYKEIESSVIFSDTIHSALTDCA